ncbi:MAG: hypothetical protein CMJ49_08865 [Planctomycetaceae bacterium]|nr:hypothetical protein [Planctomycetaceae bacterium]
MRQDGRLMAILCVMGALVLWCGGEVLGQQPAGITDHLIVEQGEFSSDEHALIRDYVGYWAGQMLGEPSAVKIASAREELLRPVRRARYVRESAAEGNPIRVAIFSETYAAQVANAISPGVSSDRMLCRLNTIIVAAELRSSFTTETIVTALGDKSAAVRLWAGKACEMAMHQRAANAPPPLGEAQQAQLHEELRRSIKAERSPWAREEMYGALGSLSIDAARADMFGLLERRVSEYYWNVRRMGRSIRADAAGFKAMSGRLMFNWYGPGADKRKLEADVRRLVILSGKYLQLMAKVAPESEKLPGEVHAVCMDMIGKIDDVLGWFVYEWKSKVKVTPLRKMWEEKRVLDFVDQVLADVGPGGELTELELGIKPSDFEIPQPKDDRAATPGGG